MTNLKTTLCMILLLSAVRIPAQENTDDEPDAGNYCDMKWTADSLYHNGDYMHAIGTLQKCLELRRTNMSDYYMLSLCYAKLRDDSDAVINLKRAVDIGLYHWRLKEFDADSNLVSMQKSKHWKKISKSLHAIVEDKNTDSIRNRLVQNQLLQMRGMDQKYRILIKNPENRDNPKAVAQLEKLQNELDSLNQIALKNVIVLYGWPGFVLVGREGDNAAWLIVQHAGKKLPFLKYCLDRMQEAIEENDTNLGNAAVLTDKVMVLSNKKQIYGTQFHQKQRMDGVIDLIFEPIEDEANVDKRRHCLGLSPLDLYKEYALRELKK